LTVVVADDDAAVRHLVSQVLTRAGFRVLEAPDGREALRLAQGEAADLVITDLVMPEREGIETIGMLAKLEPRPAIIAISGAFGGPMLRAASALGAATAVQKPFTANQLLQAVGSALA
jgi:CheY-like chemotaxis protein